MGARAGAVLDFEFGIALCLLAPAYCSSPAPSPQHPAPGMAFFHHPARVAFTPHNGKSQLGGISKSPFRVIVLELELNLPSVAAATEGPGGEGVQPNRFFNELSVT